MSSNRINSPNATIIRFTIIILATYNNTITLNGIINNNIMSNRLTIIANSDSVSNIIADINRTRSHQLLSNVQFDIRQYFCFRSFITNRSIIFFRFGSNIVCNHTFRSYMNNHSQRNTLTSSNGINCPNTATIRLTLLINATNDFTRTLNNISHFNKCSLRQTIIGYNNRVCDIITGINRTNSH